MQPGSHSTVQCAACRQSKLQYAAMQVFNYTMQHAGEAICSMHPCSIVWTFPELVLSTGASVSHRVAVLLTFPGLEVATGASVSNRFTVPWVFPRGCLSKKAFWSFREAPGSFQEGLWVFPRGPGVFPREPWGLSKRPWGLSKRHLGSFQDGL